MSQYLPISGFRFLSQEEINTIVLENESDEAEIGYVIECDMEYPSELYERHNDLPLAPEHMIMLSLFCKDMNVKRAFTEKLAGTLYSKIKYKVH